MLTCQLMGGLGNQLFQIFATLNASIRCGHPCKFLERDTLGEHGTTVRLTYWKNFLSRCRPFLVQELPYLFRIGEKGFSFTELPFDEIRCLAQDVMLTGYFQSYKYFEENYQCICRLLGMDSLRQELLLKVDLDLSNTVSMHFRLGDYKKFPNVHPLATLEYYQRAMRHVLGVGELLPCPTVYYFCEDEDVEVVEDMVGTLREEFDSVVFVRVDNERFVDWEQLLFMSCCTHHIIANSSFSWWGAYLNPSEKKVVCYPSVWFGRDGPQDTQDLCPPAWHCITV